MYKVVRIGDKEVPMLAMASADVYYKRVFHEDPLRVVTDSEGNGDRTALLFQMGFILAKAAEKDRKGMMALTENDYLDWLEQFEYGDYVAALADVAAVYYGQKATTSQEKKDLDR